MKNLLPLLLLFLFQQAASAQKSLTYISDRRFKDPTDLLGFNFRPTQKELKGSQPVDLAPGSVSFGVTRQNLFVEGDGIGGMYNINNINPTEFGFKLLLLDARNPAEQGHLKVILNSGKQCQALVFKKGTRSPEIIFHIAELPEELGKKESKFFTDRGELFVANEDSLMGRSIQPFIRLHEQTGIQERLMMGDSMRISFFETVDSIFSKPKKPSKKEAAKKAEAAQKVESEQVATDSLAADSSAVGARKVKIVRRHFLRVKGNYKFEDGSQQLKTEDFEIKHLAWREDKRAVSPDDRFLIEIELEKHAPVLLFLSDRQTVSYLEIDDLRYLMRGY